MLQLRSKVAVVLAAPILGSLLTLLSGSSAYAQQAPEPAATLPPPAVTPYVPVQVPATTVVAPAPVAPAAPVVVDPNKPHGASPEVPPVVNHPVDLPAPGPAVEAPLPPPPPKVEEKKAEAHWYDKIKIRGYTQFRYNRIPGIKRNDDLKNSQGDRYIGSPNGFGIRRARLIIQGDVHDHVSIYLQPDFASVIDTQYGVGIVRDWYADIFVDKDKTFRFRVGQSKVPFGFENLQSSSNRLAFDRSDATNTAFRDERDMGLYLYWAPKHIRERFKYLVDSGLKGSGDYGVIGIGAINGQSANRPALSDDMTGVIRATWPFQFGEQFVEIGGGGYFGKYQSTVEVDDGYTRSSKNIRDARAHATIVVYPQPFGFQAEYNWGYGPSVGEKERTHVAARKAYGGYAQLMYKIDDVGFSHALIPYARATYYEGSKKYDTNAPRHSVRELEIGIEWQLWTALELVFAYNMSHRKIYQEKLYDEKGHFGRVQVQFNY